MQKIQYSIYKRETGNASGKAKRDCSQTLEKMGFKHLYSPSANQKIRIIQQMLALEKLSIKNEEKIFALQYPAVHSKLYRLIKKAIHTDDISIAIVHDILSLQYEHFEQGLGDEINFLNNFKYIIVPNASMKKLLEDNGLKSHVINMKIYDYLHDNNREVINNAFSNSVSFAGNLTKSTFLNELNKIPNVNFVIYGANGESLVCNNVAYKGCLPSDELVYLMEGDYGLVWDGTSLDECAGTVGRYLLYNSPHKLSSYISAGKPIITWKKAAIAQFVNENGIGIVIDSLNELNYIDLRIGYDKMKKNVMLVKDQISKGIYLENALKEALDIHN